MAAWTNELRGRVQDWIADDPDPLTREQLGDLADRADGRDQKAVDDLADRFAGDLEFGTAGLRGAVGGGPNRMNLAVVIRTAAGIATWLGETAGSDGPRQGVAICFDARHRSADFAEASAAVFAAAGIRAHLLPGPLPTPVLAFAVRHLGAAAGVMVTASHNPPQDNGYKVYDGTGRQIVAPTDARIAASMAAVHRVTSVPMAGPDDPDILRLGDEVTAAYVAAASQTGRVPSARSVVTAYTAMHGVGAATFRRVMAAAGFPAAVEVTRQVEPDPEFPTVAFPNPEEPGALDLGLATASAAGAEVLIANDPDADRLGIAVPDPARGPTSTVAGWRPLRGDEIGAVLANHLLTHGGVAEGAVFATTIVSSTLLAKMAARAGVPFVETLTGFKWISRSPGVGQTLGFGYEEALGFCIGDLVGDKDGISAAVIFAEAVAVLAESGRSVLDVLDDLSVEHGVHSTGQWSARVAGTDGMAMLAAAMTALRAAPPTVLAGRPVTSVIDLIHGDVDRGFLPSDVLILYLDGVRLIVRPSGTEPKLKCYVEVVEPVADASDLAAARDRATQSLSVFIAAISDATGLA